MKRGNKNLTIFHFNTTFRCTGREGLKAPETIETL